MKKENKGQKDAEKNPLDLFDGEEPLPEVLAVAYGKARGFDPMVIWNEYRRQVTKSGIAQIFLFVAMFFVLTAIFYYHVQINPKNVLLMISAIIVPLMYIVDKDDVIIHLGREISIFHDSLDLFRNQFSDLIKSKAWKEANFEGEAGVERFRDLVREDLEHSGKSLLSLECRNGCRQGTHRNNLYYKALCANKFGIQGNEEDVLRRIEERKSALAQAEVSKELSSTVA